MRPLVDMTQGKLVHFTESTTPLAASATFTGTARDNGVAPGDVMSFMPGVKFNAFCNASHTGTFRIEISHDGTTWVTAATVALTAGNPFYLSIVMTTRYARVVVVNGGTLQTSMKLYSSFSWGG